MKEPTLEAYIKAEWSKSTVERIVKSGLTLDYIFSLFDYNYDSSQNFVPIGAEVAIDNLYSGIANEDMHAVNIKMQDTYANLGLIPQENLYISLDLLCNFWQKKYINKEWYEGYPDIDIPRYIRAFLHLIHGYEIIHFSMGDGSLRFSHDEEKLPGEGIYLQLFADDTFNNYHKVLLKNLLTNQFSLFEHSCKAFDKEFLAYIQDSKKFSFIVEKYGRKLEVIIDEFSMILLPVRARAPYDWHTYIEMMLQIVEGFWLEGCRFINHKQIDMFVGPRS